MDTHFTFKHVSKTTGDQEGPFPNTSRLTRSGASKPYTYRLENGSTTWEGTSGTRRPGWDDRVTLKEGSTNKVTLYVFPTFTYENKTVTMGIYAKHNDGQIGDPPDDQGVWMATQDLPT